MRDTDRPPWVTCAKDAKREAMPMCDRGVMSEHLRERLHTHRRADEDRLGRR